jgi:hypothetical protein
MAIHSEKTFYNRQERTQVIDEDKFRFEVFILLIEEWLRQKLRVRTVVKCLEEEEWRKYFS